MRSVLNKMFLVSIGSGLITFGACTHDTSKPASEYMPDMYVSPSYETYSDNPVFADSISAQKPVAGSIPRGYSFFHYPATTEGYEAAGRDLINPFEKSKSNTEEGKRLYGIYCMHCHGENGNGDGSLIATDKFPPPPSYYSGKSSRGGEMKDLTDGKIYHSITYGINLMGSHASQVNPEERWKIIQYVRELQKGPDGFTPDSTMAVSDTTAKVTASVVK